MVQELTAERAVVELRERLVATVSHEFRTPLTVIQASAGQIRRRLAALQIESREAERLRASCARIESATAGMVDTIERVLLIGRIAAGEERYRPRVTVPGDVLESLVADLGARCDVPREVRLDVQRARGPCGLDPLVLRQVATQLLDNALKYSSPDRAVELAAHCDEQALVLRVADRGIGIARNELALLCEPFHRGAAVRDQPGMGLGLTLVHHLLALASGELKIDSTPGGGTTVTVTLPLAPAATWKETQT